VVALPAVLRFDWHPHAWQGLAITVVLWAFIALVAGVVVVWTLVGVKSLGRSFLGGVRKGIRGEGERPVSGPDR